MEPVTIHAVEPVCPHFGSCGGCATQDIDYGHELCMKEEQFRNSFPTLPDDVFHPLQAGPPYGYRSRMDFLFHNHELCQRLKGNFRIKVPLRECHIAHSTINSILQKINGWFAERREITPYLSSPVNFNYRLLKYVTIRKPVSNPGVSLTFVVNRKSPQVAEFEEYLIQNLDSLNSALGDPLPHILIGYVNPKEELSTTPDFRILQGKATLQETLDGKEFTFHSQGFFQNNSVMIEKIITSIRQWIDKFNLVPSSKFLYDLYGGCGVFGVCLADLFKEVWVVDAEGLNIELAAENFRNNGFSDGKAGKVMMQNVKEFLGWEEYLQNMQNSIVILDPPRSGLGKKVIHRLLKRKPRALFYISCNYKVLAEEINSFLPSYEVKQIAPFDLFPRTPHLEALALLTLQE